MAYTFRLVTPDGSITSLGAYRIDRIADTHPRGTKIAVVSVYKEDAIKITAREDGDYLTVVDGDWVMYEHMEQVL